jgi:hypothetical protein
MYNTSLESMNNQTNFKDIDADDNDFFLTDDQWKYFNVLSFS